MSMNQMLSGMEISASGLTGERLRMEVAANNIANIQSTSTPEGGPYKRQQVTFSAAMREMLATGRNNFNDLKGVQVLGITSDTTPGPSMHDPGHPDADPDGYVKMPNVTLSHEMVDLGVSDLGERITEWLRVHPELQLVDRVLTQTSDDQYHCLSIMLFLTGNPETYLAEVPPVRPSAPRPPRSVG